MRRSQKLAKLYLAKHWQALGFSSWTLRECASRKRWWIYYARRAQGLGSEPREPRHWTGPAERARKQAKLLKATVNPALFRHL